MCRSEKIEHYFDWVEGLERDFHEEGVPVAHRAVPETRKFKSLEFTALIALGADETCILVDVFEEVELFSPVVLEAASEEKQETVDKKLAMPVYTKEELLQKAEADGDEPEVIEDEVSGVTLVDYSDVL